MYQLQNDIKIFRYIEFKNKKYYDGDCIEVKYNDDTSEKGILKIYLDYIVILNQPIHPRHHSLPKTGKRITEILKMSEN